MSDKFIARVEVVVDGKKIPGIISIEDGEVVHGVAVETLDGEGYAEVVPNYRVTLEYAVPASGRFDFTKTKTTPANATAYYLGGSKRIYRGLRALKEGPSKVNGKEAKTESWEFMYDERTDK